MSKKIWVITDSEPIPQLTGNGRLMRGGHFAEIFSELDCDVVWWASTWLHYEERFFSNKQEIIDIHENLKVFLLHAGKAYKKHISVDRLLYCSRIGRQFHLNAEEFEKPQLIVCSWPLIELGYEAVKFGKKNNIPVVLDIRDMWPEIFTRPFSGIIRLFAKAGIQLLYGRKTRYTMRNATQVIGVIDYAVGMAYRWGRDHNPKDKTVYLSNSASQIKYDEEKIKTFWQRKNVNQSDFLVIFIGTISYQSGKIKTIAEAASNFKGTEVKFVFCGNGPDYISLEEEAKQNPNIVLAGYCNRDELDYLGKIAQIGLILNNNTEDFINALPNKFSGYLSSSLIVFTSLSGEMKKLVEGKSCGEYFEDAKMLTSKILMYKNDPVLVKVTKQKSLQLFKEQFNADIVYKGICKDVIYEYC